MPPAGGDGSPGAPNIRLVSVAWALLKPGYQRVDSISDLWRREGNMRRVLAAVAALAALVLGGGAGISGL